MQKVKDTTKNAASYSSGDAFKLFSQCAEIQLMLHANVMASLSSHVLWHQRCTSTRLKLCQSLSRLTELPHDKTNKMSVCPAKTHISLGIRPVWSEPLLSAWRKLGSLPTHWVCSEDSDQSGRMPRLIWLFAMRTLILLVLSCHGSNSGQVCKSTSLFLSRSCLSLHSLRQLVSTRG